MRGIERERKDRMRGERRRGIDRMREEFRGRERQNEREIEGGGYIVRGRSVRRGMQGI